MQEHNPGDRRQFSSDCLVSVGPRMVWNALPPPNCRSLYRAGSLVGSLVDLGLRAREYLAGTTVLRSQNKASAGHWPVSLCLGSTIARSVVELVSYWK